MEPEETAEAPRAEVMATINLPGLRRGERALVDPSDPYIAACLAGGFLAAAAPQSGAE